MRIREITKQSIREGALGNIGRGFVQGLTGVDFSRDQSTLDQDTRNQARKLAQKWVQQNKTQQKSQPAATQNKASQPSQYTPPTDPAEIADMKARGFDPATGQRVTPGATASAASTQPIMLGGKRLDPKNPNDAKILAAIQAQGKLQEAPAEYTTRSGIVVPGGTRTDPKSLGMVDFERWADQQLTTQISGTRQQIDLDAVKKDPAVKAELDKVLPQIKKDPTNLAAVEMYLLTAMQAMQERANVIKQTQVAGIK
jgi:hypothetical protein